MLCSLGTYVTRLLRLLRLLRHHPLPNPANIDPILLGPLLALMLTIFLILACLFTGVISVPFLPIPRLMKQETIWGPTAVFYWRCQSPYLVESSWDKTNWKPSSICLEGTCCSTLAEGPLCSIENCALVSQEPDKPQGHDPQSATQHRSPKRPVFG